MAASQASESHTRRSFVVHGMGKRENEGWQRGNDPEVSGGTFGEDGGSWPLDGGGKVGRSEAQGSGDVHGINREDAGRDSSHDVNGMAACNSQKCREGAVLPTLREYEGSHVRKTHVEPPPADTHGQVVESPRGRRASVVQPHAAYLKAVNSGAAAATSAAAAASLSSSVQQQPPALPSTSSTPSLVSAVLQSVVYRSSIGAADLELSPSCTDSAVVSHMQHPYDGPLHPKLPPSPPPPLSLVADDKLKVLSLSAEDHSCLSTEGKSTFFQATLNCVSLLYGLGILSSPFAVAKAGWMGAIISIAVSSAYAYTAHLMAKCVEYDAGCSNYQDIAKLTLGRRMRRVITALFYMELTGTLVGYCISMGDNLNYIFPHLSFSVPGLSSRNFMICTVSLIILPSVWLRDLSALSFTSIWCIASSLLLLVAVLLAATVNHIGFHHPLPFLNVKGVPIAAGLYAFSYGGTSVFPSIYKSMKDPSKFTQVLALSFVIATASIAGLGVAGAFMFGDHTASQVTLSMPTQFISTKIVLWTTILTPIFKFALQLSPITTAVEKQIYKHGKNAAQTASNRTLLYALSTLMRSFVLALIVIVSMILPYFEYMIALVGSSMTIATCLLFPCFFYLKLYWKSLSIHKIAFIIILIFLGVIVGICGTVIAFGGLINSRKNHATSL